MKKKLRPQKILTFLFQNLTINDYKVKKSRFLTFHRGNGPKKWSKFLDLIGVTLSILFDFESFENVNNCIVLFQAKDIKVAAFFGIKTSSTEQGV